MRNDCNQQAELGSIYMEPGDWKGSLRLPDPVLLLVLELAGLVRVGHRL